MRQPVALRERHRKHTCHGLEHGDFFKIAIRDQIDRQSKS
jgi:hypothetical protein